MSLRKYGVVTVLSLMCLLYNVPANAEGTNIPTMSAGDSLEFPTEIIEETQDGVTESEEGTKESLVEATGSQQEYIPQIMSVKDNYFEVALPKQINLVGGAANYKVKVTGDIDKYTTVSVVPDSTFPMKQTGKTDVLMNVTQDKQSWVQGELDGAHNATGTVTSKSPLSAGVWKGELHFNITTNINRPLLWDGGLYDANDNLVADWETLVNTYGLDVTKDYTYTNYKTETTSGCYVLNNTPELAAGRKLVIPTALSYIGSNCFHECVYLTDITIQGNTSVGSYGFCGNPSLINLNLPERVDSSVHYDSCAFYTNYGVKQIRIPEGLVKISDNSFARLGIEYIYIPDSVKVIEHDAFERTFLKNIYIPASVEQITTYIDTAHNYHYGPFNGIYCDTFKIYCGVPYVQENNAHYRFGWNSKNHTNVNYPTTVGVSREYYESTLRYQ